MKSAKTRILLLTCALVLLGVTVMQASDPVGIYAVVDRVVLEPNETAPQRIQVWGTFRLWEGQPFSGGKYSAPKKGYLYYTIAPGGNSKIERAEWADLKAIAGTGQGVGFGGRYKESGRIRPATEKAAAPDVYPVGVGLTKVGIGGYKDQMTEIITGLKKANLKP